MQLKAALGKHIPFPRYFTMDHPIGGKGMAGLPKGLQVPPGGGVGGGTLSPGDLDPEANTYYVQSLSVIEYLCDRAGKPLFRYCVHELQQGRTMDEILEAWHEHRKDLRKLARELKKLRRTSHRAREDEGAGARATTVARAAEDDSFAASLRLKPGDTLGLLPRTVAQLEQDWLHWVQASYPSYQPDQPDYPD